MDQAALVRDLHATATRIEAISVSEVSRVEEELKALLGRLSPAPDEKAAAPPVSVPEEAAAPPTPAEEPTAPTE